LPVRDHGNRSADLQRSSEEEPIVSYRRARGWYVLLALPFLGLLYPPLYGRHDPELFGFPFFYWYQLAWVPVTALLTIIVYRKVPHR
jgi:hypothetical protein